jgi:hypothetical protein
MFFVDIAKFIYYAYRNCIVACRSLTNESGTHQVPGDDSILNHLPGYIVVQGYQVSGDPTVGSHFPHKDLLLRCGEFAQPVQHATPFLLPVVHRLVLHPRVVGQGEAFLRTVWRTNCIIICTGPSPQGSCPSNLRAGTKKIWTMTVHVTMAKFRQ